MNTGTGIWRSNAPLLNAPLLNANFVSDFVSKRLALLFAARTPTALYSYFLGHTYSSGEWRSTGEACPLEGGCIVAGLLLGCTLIVAVATFIDRCYTVLVAPLSDPCQVLPNHFSGNLAMPQEHVPE